jgi:hypothetical protein
MSAFSLLINAWRHVAANHQVRFHNHLASNVPAGTIVASLSGPVEIIPISTCKKSPMNRK